MQKRLWRPARWPSMCCILKTCLPGACLLKYRCGPHDPEEQAQAGYNRPQGP